MNNNLTTHHCGVTESSFLTTSSIILSFVQTMGKNSLAHKQPTPTPAKNATIIQIISLLFHFIFREQRYKIFFNNKNFLLIFCFFLFVFPVSAKFCIIPSIFPPSVWLTILQIILSPRVLICFLLKRNPFICSICMEYQPINPLQKIEQIEAYP